ncbi:hypothetical protein [uncultured Eudoraea sp.]|uniref:hypothetical protein n=1 Tax=uncultured Eudoraea sp. TaxID=1035614 RepID=UPI0026151E1C|nr:hypothetical protein [uncultured Eudoraea sp.]
MKNKIFIICLYMMLIGCSNSGDDNDTEPVLNPTAVTLVFPYEDSLCNEGTNVTETESTVLFEWQPSDHTDTYALQLKNLSSGITTSHDTSNTELAIVISRATPYEWYVISQSNTVGETAQSQTWKFYNAGEGVQTYAPFPAEIIYPLMAQIISTTESQIYLKWKGTDVDDDIIGYDVYFGTTEQPDIFVSGHDSGILNDVPVATNTIYYWKVVTKDSEGNSSDSGLFQFKIE